MDSNTMIHILIILIHLVIWVGMENEDIITKEKFYKNLEKV